MAQEQPAPHSAREYQGVAEAHLGPGVSCAVNKARTMVLCQQVEMVTKPAMINRVHYLVILLKDNSILFEDRMANARVEWFNNSQLKVSLIPGTVRRIPGQQQQHYYLFDLETKQQVFPPSDKL